MKGEMKRSERDEVMKKIGPNIGQAKHGVISNSLYWRGGGGVSVKVYRPTYIPNYIPIYIHTL